MNINESKTNLNCNPEPIENKNHLSPEKTEVKTIELPIGILMGATGTGKTSLLNKLYGIKDEGGWSQVSNSRKIFKNSNEIGGFSFELIETPGTYSQEETYKHALYRRETLTFCEANTIFIFVKYDNRHVRIAESFWKVLTPVQRYERKIVAVISHWDLSTNTEEKESIRTILSQEIAGIIFYSENDNPEEVVNSISSFLEKMPREKLEIPNQEFSMNLNFSYPRNSIMNHYSRNDENTMSARRKKKQSISYQSGNCVSPCSLF